MRATKWTETAIKQAFDDFINQHDRLPTRQEMYGRYNGRFPRPLSVKLSLGITLGEYLETNYTTFLHRCQSKRYNRMTVDYWIENFKSQYIKFGKPPQEKYDQMRDKNTPNSKTLTNIVGVANWNELLIHCSFYKNKRTDLQGEVVFDESFENYQKFRKKSNPINLFKRLNDNQKKLLLFNLKCPIFVAN